VEGGLRIGEDAAQHQAKPDEQGSGFMDGSCHNRWKYSPGLLLQTARTEC
jgi:hypothetical protein